MNIKGKHLWHYTPQDRLAMQEIELLQKEEKADKVLAELMLDTEISQREKAKADAEEKKVNAITKEVIERQRLCELDLQRAEPILEACERALNTLTKPNLTELKVSSRVCRKLVIPMIPRWVSDCVILSFFCPPP
jgi:hypothetical protein